jgi:P-type E1-E2 ATPase
LWVAALLSFIVGSITVGVAVVLIVVLNAAVAFLQEGHAENAVEALAGYIPQKLTVVRDGTRKVIDTAELVPGDIALVGEGEQIAADLRLISGAVEVDLSTLTGESVPRLSAMERLGTDVEGEQREHGERQRHSTAGQCEHQERIVSGVAWAKM